MKNRFWLMSPMHILNSRQYDLLTGGFGGIVHTQAERLTGKKPSSKVPYTHLRGTSAIVSLLTLLDH